MSRPWNNQLFDYMNNPVILLISCLVPLGPHLLQVLAVDKVTHGGKCGPYCMILCLGVIGSALNRETIRGKLNVEGNCMRSCCAWYCCAFFAATQEYNEVLGVVKTTVNY